MTDYLSFYAGAMLKAMLLPRFDAVVTLTTPPIIGLVGTLLKRLKGSRHVYWSMDLHPDASLALGRMSPQRRLGRCMHWLSGFVYRQADRVVVLGPYMADRIALKGVAAERIATIPVWSRREEIYPIPRGPTRCASRSAWATPSWRCTRATSAWPTRSTSSSRPRGGSAIARTSSSCSSGPARGSPKSRPPASARAWRTSGFLDYVAAVAPAQCRSSMADVHLISMRPEMTGIVVPGKLYGVMAAGRPAVFVGPEHCESADTIRDAGCGITIDPGDVDGLVAALMRLAADPSLARRMGERGRSAFLVGARAKTLLRTLARADRRSWSPDRKPAGTYWPHRDEGRDSRDRAPRSPFVHSYLS